MTDDSGTAQLSFDAATGALSVGNSGSFPVIKTDYLSDLANGHIEVMSPLLGNSGGTLEVLGGIKLSDDTAACNIDLDADGIPDNAGRMRYHSAQSRYEYCNGAAWVPFGDDMGDHTATQNIALGSLYLSGDGDDEGLFIDADGKIGIGNNAPASLMHVSGGVAIGNDTDTCIPDKDGTLRYTGGDPAWEFCNGSDWVPFERAAGGGGNQVQKLLQSDSGLDLIGADVDRFFGSSVSISGDIAVIGAPGGSNNPPDDGSASIYARQDDGSWQYLQRIEDPGSDGIYFGSSVSIHGDVLIVGDNGYYQQRGRGRAYVRSTSGLFNYQATIYCSGMPKSANGFRRISMSGDNLLVGFGRDDAYGTNSGSVCVFRRQSDGTWIEQAKTLASDGEDFDYFGGNISLSGDVAAIGAGGDKDNGTQSGSAYIFNRQDDGTWAEHTKLLASDGAEYDFFGSAVSISGDVAVIGAAGDDDLGPSSGSAYIFEKQDNGTWLERAKLIASDGQKNDRFGVSVSIDGDVVVVGADGDGDGAWSGSAYIFSRTDNGSWIEKKKIRPSDGAPSDFFARSGLAISGDVLIVGATHDDDDGPDKGSAYIFSTLPQ